MKIDDLITIKSVGPKLVPVSSIVTFADTDIDGHELIMRPINKAHAKRIAKSNGKWPDIECVQILWKNTDHFLLIDGRHRLEAGKLLGMENIRVAMRTYQYPEDIVEAAIVANAHHGLPIQRFKVTEHILWLYANDYEIDQIADILELDEKSVRRIIARFEAESEIEGGSTIAAKTDGQLLIEYIVRLHKRANNAATIAHEMAVAMNETSEAKQDEYIDSLQFMADVIRRIRIQ